MLQRTWWRTHSPFGSLIRSILLASIAGWFFAGVAQTPDTPQTVSGSVLDAVSGQPVFRALVRLGSRAVLTDSEGHFSFANADPSALNITAIKPGYFFAEGLNEPTEISLNPGTLADPVQLRLYPEAIVKGSVSDQNGAPLANVSIEAYRNLSEGAGRRWVPVAATHSDSHGNYRIPLRTGDYRIESGYFRTSPASAVLPTVEPEGESSTGALHVRSGDDLTLDLHPSVAPLYEVDARTDTSLREVNALNAILSNGTSFPVSFTQTGSSSFRASLPPGSYLLEALHRNFGANAVDEAGISLSPAQHQPIPLTLHFTPAASIPIAIAIDDASVSAATAAGQTLVTPNARELGLELEPDGAGSELIRSRARGNSETSFSAPPGTYRLRAQPGRPWYVVSATFGGQDVLAHDLQLAAGAGSTPLQIVVSNQTATLQGTVTLDGKPASCWIYLIATGASAAPILTLHSGQDGTFNFQWLPPGSYQAVAFPQRMALDASDPNLLAPYATRLGSVTAKVQTAASLSLEAVPESELRP